MNTNLSITLKKYLVSIYRLCQKQNVARVSEIAESMRVHKTTVTSTLKSLAKMKLVNYSPYQYVTLTEKGEKISIHFINRTKIAEKFFRDVLLLPEEISERNSEMVYNIVDEVVLKRLNDIHYHQSSCLRCSNLTISWTSDNKVICPLKKKNEN